jgi:serine/threonine protein kinase
LFSGCLRELDMIGRIVSHYRILSPLGSGGMGVVYLAEDARLGRQVALKFLPASYSQEAKALERFRVEARAASSLSHPAICAIYDIGQDGDTPFIVMEALKGETLRERIAKGALKVTDVLDVSIQLADALEAAHAQGIVHRDIKPANIFLSDRNRVKVLDFGLAKLTSSPSSLSSAADTTSPGDKTQSNQITQPGTALGTVSYMSPEQARGENIDSRTDLFSLGAVMYEMVTGSQAFGGSTTAVVYDAILNRAPRPIAQLNPLIPPRLETVIATALEKERDLRYQHASDLQAELRRIRRDIEAGSLVSSQSVMTTRRDSASALSGSAPTQATGGSRWRERSAIVVAALAIVVAAALLFWRPRGTDGDAGTGQVAQAPVSPPVVAAPQGNAPPPVVEPSPTVPPQNPPATPPPDPPRGETPRPQPRVAPAPQTPANERAPLPPPPAATAPRPAPTQPAPTQPAPTTTPPPAAVSPAVTEPSVPAPEEAKPQPQPAPVPAPEPVAPPPVQPAAPPPRAAAPEPAPAAPAAPVETDEAAIRRVIRIYEQAIETQDVALYRSVRPGLTRAAETVLMNSFRQIDSQEIEIRVENLRIEGRTATARIARRDTLTTSGRRQTQNSTQTLRFAKTDTGWIIAE